MLSFSVDAGCTQGAHETVCFSKKLALFLRNMCLQGTHEIQRFVKYRALCSKDRSLFRKTVTESSVGKKSRVSVLMQVCILDVDICIYVYLSV